MESEKSRLLFSRVALLKPAVLVTVLAIGVLKRGSRAALGSGTEMGVLRRGSRAALGSGTEMGVLRRGSLGVF